MLRFGCQLQMCSKRLKVFTLVMQEMRKKGSVCNVTDVSAWKHVNFKQGDIASTVDTQNIQKVFWTNIINIMHICVPASLMQSHRNTKQVQRKPHSPEKICLYRLTLVPMKKAKDERNISAQSMCTKPKTGNLTNLHLHFPAFHTTGR